MDARQSIIEQLTYSTALDICTGYAYGYDHTRADVERANADGWTVETSGPLGSVVRHEGVRLSAAELDRVWRRATALVESGEVR